MTKTDIIGKADEMLDNGSLKLSGGALWIAALMLALGNFIAVLDMTITNVAVPTIAGSLGITNSQGTWVITSYAVAEAIIVPLTGWLAARFGSVRVFTVSMLLFGIASFLCGISHTFEMLIFSRVLQGLSGGPMMPLSQTLLMRIFPKEKAGAAMGIWAMTTLVAPVAGPILGGYICDNYAWEFAFLINVPIAIICSVFAWPLLKRYEVKIIKQAIDYIGLILLIIWVCALQIMLDLGKEHDWFAATEVRVLFVIFIIGLIAFIIWELTEEHPIVNLRVFRHRGYTAALITLVFAFGAFFGINVLNPLWLQGFMGYTSEWSGKATAWSGVLAVIASPIVAGLLTKFDPRKMVFIGVSWLGIIALIRSFGTTDMTYWNVALPLLIMGIGLPLFFVPLSGLALSSVNPEEAESASGLMAFLRTLAGAIATSIVTTVWEGKIKQNYADMVGSIDASGEVARQMAQMGQTKLETALIYSQNLQGQAVMLATNQTFFVLAFVTFFAAMTIWFAPKPKPNSGPQIMGH